MSVYMKRLPRSAEPARRRAKAPTSLHIAKISHTLEVDLAERLEQFAFMQRISESSVIEFAVRQFFRKGNDTQLGSLLRRNGAGRRRLKPVHPRSEI
jgi:hypothetical protein